MRTVFETRVRVIYRVRSIYVETGFIIACRSKNVFTKDPADNARIQWGTTSVPLTIGETATADFISSKGFATRITSNTWRPHWFRIQADRAGPGADLTCVYVTSECVCVWARAYNSIHLYTIGTRPKTRRWRQRKVHYAFVYNYTWIYVHYR